MCGLKPVASNVYLFWAWLEWSANEPKVMGLVPRRASWFHGKETCDPWFTDFSLHAVYLSLNYVALVPRGPSEKV